MIKRFDEHRPSVVKPEDYDFVAFENLKYSEPGLVLANRKYINEHMARTGGTYASHEHGGNCHICGAHAIWTYLFHHRPSNTYIRTGSDCGELLDARLAERFRRFKDGVDGEIEAIAGKRKAKATLEAGGLGTAWEIYSEYRENAPAGWVPNGNGGWMPEDGHEPSDYELTRMWKEYYRLNNEESIIRDIVRRLVKYGSISDKTKEFVGSLLKRIETRGEREAKFAAEKATAADVPEGKRILIEGTVVSKKIVESEYGITHKMLIKGDAGWTVWSTIPASMSVEKGDRVAIKATVTRSENDPKFGIAKRPVAA